LLREGASLGLILHETGAPPRYKSGVTIPETGPGHPRAAFAPPAPPAGDRTLPRPAALVKLAPIAPVPELPLAPDRFREEMHSLARRAARDGGWGAGDGRAMRELFDERAPTWNEGRGEAYLAPLRDAIDRGGVAPGRWCLEIGSGTGLQTPTLAAHFTLVAALDVAAEMLARAPRDAAARLRADASRLPVAAASIDAVVCVNAFLFPSEYVRVLRPGGCVVFVSTRGAATPIYLEPDEVASALAAAATGPVEGVTSGIGASRWSVLRFAQPHLAAKGARR
jgi:hypothetical protein